MRLDKMLRELGYGTRSEIGKYCKKGLVTVNGEIAKKPETKVDPEKDRVCFEGQEVVYRKYIYIMLNKPEGCVSATFDNHDSTVLDLIDEDYLVFEPFPVGRLDKDTEGLLLITNDGALAHELLSPKKHVDKKYYARLENPLKESDIEAFKKGLDLGDFVSKPGVLEIISEREAYVTISEGKFHQVKRMFEAGGNKVTYLKRLEMGALKLDESLNTGEYRELTEEEIKLLKI